MRTHAKLVATAVAVATVLAVTVGTAPARNLSVSETTFKAFWEVVNFNGVQCILRMDGEFHTRTLAKTQGSLIGNVTVAFVNEEFEEEAGCRLAVLIGTLPWHVRYAGFTGTLPNITGIQADIIGFAILKIGREIFNAFNFCLYRSTATNPLKVRITRSATGRLIEIRPDETAGLVLDTNLGGGQCPLYLEVRGGTENFTIPNTTTRITLTLI